MAEYIKREDAINVIKEAKFPDDFVDCHYEDLVSDIQKIPAAPVISPECYEALAEQVNILADKIIKIREILGCRNV